MKINTRLDKFAELLLYIAKKCENDPHFGATKLNKILFFSDFAAYRIRQKSITGATYQRLDHGPAPKCMLPVREQLLADKSLEIQDVVRFGFTQRRPRALRNPNLEIFSGEEISLVDDVISAMRDETARTVSAMSHGFWWEVAENGEEIPIEVSLVEFPEEASPDEQIHARSLEKRASELVSAA
jgi:hypothetical protein